MTRTAAVACTFIIAASAVTALCQTPTKNGTARPVIKERPEPAWPSSIKKQVDFTVILHAIFRANGKVTDISRYGLDPEKPEGLSQEEIDSLTERAIDAAARIKFVPAAKDGHSVSMWMELQYHFQLSADQSESPTSKKKQP